MFIREEELVSIRYKVAKEFVIKYGKGYKCIVQGLNTGAISFSLVSDYKSIAEAHVCENSICGYIAGESQLAMKYLLACIIRDDAILKFNDTVDISKSCGIVGSRFAELTVIELADIERTCKNYKEHVIEKIRIDMGDVTITNIKFDELSPSMISLLDSLNNDGGKEQCLVALYRGEQVGVLTYVEQASILLAVGVTERFRRNGIGTLLVSKFKSLCEGTPITSGLELNSYKFWESIGGKLFNIGQSGLCMDKKEDYYYNLLCRNISHYYMLKERTLSSINISVLLYSDKESFISNTEVVDLSNKEYREESRRFKSLVLTGFPDRDTRHLTGGYSHKELIDIYSKVDSELDTNINFTYKFVGNIPGDIVVLKSRGNISDPLCIPKNIGSIHYKEVVYHFVHIYEGIAYDKQYDYKPIPENEYFDMLEKATPSGIRVDITLSPSSHGLPTKREITRNDNMRTPFGTTWLGGSDEGLDINRIFRSNNFSGSSFSQKPKSKAKKNKSMKYNGGNK